MGAVAEVTCIASAVLAVDAGVVFTVVLVDVAVLVHDVTVLVCGRLMGAAILADNCLSVEETGVFIVFSSTECTCCTGAVFEQP